MRDQYRRAAAARREQCQPHVRSELVGVHHVDLAAAQQAHERTPAPDIDLRPTTELEHLDPLCAGRLHVLREGRASRADDALEAIGIEAEGYPRRYGLRPGGHERVDHGDDAEPLSIESLRHAV